MGGIDFAVYITPELVTDYSKTERMAKKVVHRASSRGRSNHGWLDSHHTFSFASYHNPERIHFGMLRVLNDDIVAPGMGFSSHHHENMEIISIPLEGTLEHRDDLGNISFIKKGDVQVMSAGTGINHSEFNANRDHLAKFLQIWIFTDKKNAEPRYGQARIDQDKINNQLQMLVSPPDGGGATWIHQNAWIHMGNLDKGETISYNLKDKTNGLYVFLIKGEADINGNELHSRDGIGLWDTTQVSVEAITSSTVLLIEVPLN